MEIKTKEKILLDFDDMILHGAVINNMDELSKLYISFNDIYEKIKKIENKLWTGKPITKDINDIMYELELQM